MMTPLPCAGELWWLLAMRLCCPYACTLLCVPANLDWAALAGMECLQCEATYPTYIAVVCLGLLVVQLHSSSLHSSSPPTRHPVSPCWLDPLTPAPCFSCTAPLVPPILVQVCPPDASLAGSPVSDNGGLDGALCTLGGTDGSGAGETGTFAPIKIDHSPSAIPRLA